MEFEIKWVEDKKKYDTWKIAQDAYKKRLAEVDNKIYWNDIKSELQAAHAFKTKSKKCTAMLADLDVAVAAEQKAKVQSLSADIKAKQEEIIKAGPKTKGGGMFSEEAYSQERKNKAFWCKSTYESKNNFSEWAQQIYNNLPEEERHAVREYTGGSGKFNRPMREYDKSWEKSSFKGIGNVPLNNEGAKKEIKSLYQMLDKCAYNSDVWLQRGVSTEGLISFLDIPHISKIQTAKLLEKGIVDYGFASCGAAKGTGFSGHILNIYCPKGTKMFYAEDISYFKGENEMLLQAGTKFRIKKIEIKNQNTFNKIFIDLEVIGYEKHPLL